MYSRCSLSKTFCAVTARVIPVAISGEIIGQPQVDQCIGFNDTVVIRSVTTGKLLT